MKKIEGGEPEGTSSPSSPEIKRIEPLPNWEDMFPQRMEMMRQAEQRKNKDEYPPNPYRHNIRSYQKPPLGPSPLKPRKVRPDEIKDKINQLEKVSKACVDTIGEGIDSYWMMNKDLENKVNDIDGRVGFLIKTVFELSDEKKLLQKKFLKLQFDMAELSNRFASIAKACNMDEEGDVFFTPKKE